MRMTTSDNSLAQAAANGDREAFSALLARHYDAVFRLGFRLTGSQAEAEDLTQDICAALPTKLRGYKANAKFTTWLYRVTVNAAHDRRRRFASHAKAAEGWGDWERNRVAVNKDAQDGLDWLQQAMTSLPPDLRDTTALLMDDDMTQAQAALILGVSEGTIAWRMSEVKKHLRNLYKKEQEA